MGVLLPDPLITPRALECNFTNEMAADGQVRFLKNIAGLWILQECRRAWAQAGQEYSYEQLTGMAGNAEPYRGYFPPDEFLSPGHMPERIEAWCRANGQPVPDGVAAMTRAVLECLAQKYNEVLLSLEEVTGKSIRTIHIVGGGCKNLLLNRLVEERTGRKVVAGPVEATALGNVLSMSV
jgi:rhamnulokinase